jgi:hypothetical protein
VSSCCSAQPGAPALGGLRQRLAAVAYRRAGLPRQHLRPGCGVGERASWRYSAQPESRSSQFARDTSTWEGSWAHTPMPRNCSSRLVGLHTRRCYGRRRRRAPPVGLLADLLYIDRSFTWRHRGVVTAPRAKEYKAKLVVEIKRKGTSSLATSPERHPRCQDPVTDSPLSLRKSKPATTSPITTARSSLCDDARRGLPPPPCREGGRVASGNCSRNVQGL